MNEIARALLTFGQLSVWRSIADLPSDRRSSANLQRTWSLPEGSTVAAVRAALDRLELRHESLRTGYARHGRRAVEQVVWAPVGIDAIAVEVDGRERIAAQVAGELAAQPFALDRERPVRARVVTTDGRPTHLALCVHHLAADAAGLDLVLHQLLELLGGATLDEPAPMCRAIAEAQRTHKHWLVRAEAAVDYWRRTIQRAGPAPAVREAGEVHWSRLLSQPALDAARALAEATTTSVQTVVLSAYCRALADHDGQDQVLVGLLVANRNDPAAQALVSSVNQLVPLLIEVPADCSFDALARRVHVATLLAGRHGCFDVDALGELTESHGYDGSGVGFHRFFNFMPDSAAPVDASITGRPWSIETHTRGRDNGFAFYLKGGDGDQLDLSLRQRGEDSSVTERFLLSLHDILLAAAPSRAGRA